MKMKPKMKVKMKIEMKQMVIPGGATRQRR
jgi:hypothetical protein